MPSRHPPRRLALRQLPYIVRRRGWATAVTALLVPIVLGLGLLMLTAAIALPKTPLGLRLFLLPGGAVMLIACLIAVDRSFAYHVAIVADGIWLNGLLFRRFIAWDEITAVHTHPNFRLPGYYAAIRVDGSRNPKRHWSSLWFGFYDIPPLMMLGGKALTRLLRHAKRRAQAGWPEAPPRKTRKSI